MTDDEVEMFLNDLSEEDWVFMVSPDGKLKSLMIPNFRKKDLINKKILKILSLLNADAVKELNKLEEEPESFEDLTKKPDDTMH